MTRPRKNAPKPNTQELSLVPVEDQPYPLPEGWKWVRLGDALHLQAGKNISARLIQPEKSEEFPYPCFGGNGIRGYVSSYNHEGDYPLIGRQGALCGNINFATGKFYATEHAVAVSPKLPCNIIWVSHCLKDMNLNQYATATAQPGLAVSNLNLLPFPYPPIEEQERIVTRIESLFAKLDEAKEKAEAVLDSYETRKAAILHKAFTGELTHTSPTNYQSITYFTKKTKNALKAGPFGSALKKDFYVPSGYKIYGQEQVISGDETFGDYYINEEKYQELISCKIKAGDVLISLVGTVGKVLVLSENCKPGIINPRLIKITLDQTKMLPKFFSYYFQSDEVKASYKESSHGTTMDVLNMGILKQINFPCFTIPEQQEITRILDSLLEKEQQSKEAVESVLEQIDLMKKAILAKAFRGELG